MSTDPEIEQRGESGLRRGRITGAWAYLIVATPVIVFLFAAAYLVSALA